MGIPVVIAANGYGTPVTVATNGYGLPVEIASNGIGMPVVLVASGGMPVVGSFGPDVTAPLAVSFSPTDNATGVNVSTLLIVTFDSLVTLGTGNVTLKRTSDNATIEAWDVVTEAGTGAGQVSVEFSTQLTMRLTTSIAAGTEYYVIWDANVVKDVANNPVAANASTTLWSFTTAAGGSYDAETEAIAAAFTTPPTTARKNLIDAVVVALKAGGVWTKLDALYAFAAADSQAAKINWKAPGTFNCTEVNAPAFAADQGFTGASTKYLDTGSTLGTGTNYAQNNACIFVYSALENNTGSGIVGTTGGGITINPRLSGTFYGQVNNGGSTCTAASATAIGFWSATRASSTSLEMYKNAVSVDTDAVGGTFAPSGALWFLRQQASYDLGQVSVGGFGQSLNSTEQTALYNALAAYMAGLATDRIAAAFTTPPSAGRKTLIQNCVTSLMQAGVWDKLDALYAFAAADSQAAKINWVAPGTFNCTEVNAPTFTVDRGFTGNVSTMYLDTGFIPSSAPSPKMVLNSACMFGHDGTSAVTSVPLLGTSSDLIVIYSRYTGDHAYARINQTTVNLDGSSTGSAFWSATRSGATASELFKNGASAATHAQASTAVSTTSMLFLRSNTFYGAGQITCGGFGSHLNSTEQTALYNALRTYLTGVGVP